MDEPTSAEWVIGEWVTLDRELHPFEALELATVIEAVKLHVLHGWPRWWAWTFASLVAQIAIGILEAAAGELVIVDHDVGETIHSPAVVPGHFVVKVLCGEDTPNPHTTGGVAKERRFTRCAATFGLWRLPHVASTAEVSAAILLLFHAFAGGHAKRGHDGLGGRMGGTRTTTTKFAVRAGRGRPADRTLMVEPDSAEPIWKTRAACRGVAACPVSWSSAT